MEKAKPPKPPWKYGPLEIQDEGRRREAYDALCALWDAMDLSERHTILRDPLTRETLHDAYHAIGELILGEDCPEKEIFT